METKINLNEKEVRSLVRQELKFYLLQEGKFANVYHSLPITQYSLPDTQSESLKKGNCLLLSSSSYANKVCV